MRGLLVGTCLGLALVCAGGWGGAAIAQESPATATVNPAASGGEARLLSPAQWRRQQLLRVAVERYPQLLDGHPNASVAVLALALRPDGSIAVGEIGFAGSPESIVNLPDILVNLQGQGPVVLQGLNPANAARVSSLQQSMTAVLEDAGGTAVQMEGWARGAATPQGRPLAIDLSLYHTRVPADFDAGRSATRVRGIVRRHHTDLLYTGDNTRNRLTVLLDAQGGLLNRHVDRVAWAHDPPTSASAAGVMAQARELALRLGVDVSQVGLLGNTVVREGGEWYHVAYAWQRQPGESGPHMLQAPPPAPQLDLAAAEAIVRQHLPASAAGSVPAGRTAAVVLSATGEVLRAGYVPMQNGGLARQALEEPLLAGMRVQEVLLHPVGQGSGGTRTVLFVWEAAAPADSRSMPADVPVRVRR